MVLFLNLFALIFSAGCSSSSDENLSYDYFSSLILKEPLIKVNSDLLYEGEGYLIPSSAVSGSEENPSVLSLIDDNGTIYFKQVEIKIIKKIDDKIVAAKLTPGEIILSDRKKSIKYLQDVMPETFRKRFVKAEPTLTKQVPPEERNK